MKRLRIALVVTVLLAALLLPWAVRAATGSPVLSSWTVDGGGGASSGGAYALAGTIGQPDANLLNGGSYTLYGGFWGADTSTLPWRRLPGSSPPTTPSKGISGGKVKP